MNNLADQAIKSALIGFENVFEYSFLERGSMKGNTAHQELIYLYALFVEQSLLDILNIIQVRIIFQW